MKIKFLDGTEKEFDILYSRDLWGADLRGADLSGADLSLSNLSGADLSRANLCRANLYGSNLGDANLSGARLLFSLLHGANLQGANLSGAVLNHASLANTICCFVNFSGAFLYRTDLYAADLREANLSGASLTDANLSSVDLRRAAIGPEQLKELIATRTVVGTGVLRGFKKLANGAICELEIPAEAGRVGGVVGRKCRAEFARVISGAGPSLHDKNFLYTPGETIRPDEWNPDPFLECAHGIHFFITREEAEAYE